ncbi:DUF1178 family protein [Variovorax sp. V59]|jgi:hypothetical protein|uniref:DUF1178 family protein n=2 Tax=Variovorax TaxID=34072 RepID=A0AAE3Y682_VARPD|nr:MULTISPECIES: DUF1178 family protein [Variovorax]MDP9968352.1 hypothetical protein [Variovorax paradoxus]MDR6430058.1 hypothetical protein [Variovorax paradoxus]TWD74657.1 hypothetical protein FB547_12036 [Variovorax beijingensis]
MKVLDLRCSHGHGFEGWFASNEAFETQLAAGLVECPVCADTRIVKLLSAPRLNLGNAKAPAEAAAASASASSAPAKAQAPAEQSPEARWMRAVREVLAKTEDVGDRFADEARRMHYGEAEERGIRGQATREQTEALLEEGIPVMALPIPAALKETLQ